MTTIKNLVITQGDSLLIKVSIEDTLTKALIDQSGGYVYFTIKENQESTDDTDADAIVTVKQAGTNTETSILLLPEHTALPIKTYYYDIQFIDVTGNPFTVFKGELAVGYQITRRNS